MKLLFYKALMAVSNMLGEWFFKAGAWAVATGYFLLFPSRVRTSMDFYRALMPGKNLPAYLGCAWRQFHSFTNVFLDRYMLLKGERVTYSEEGWEILEEALRAKQGGILLMSHLGNWEVAAYILKEKGLDLLLYLGKKQGEQIEAYQKESLARNRIRVSYTDGENQSPFEILDGIGHLRRSGFISTTGDRLWTDGQRSVKVKFLGRDVLLPETPYLLALHSGMPIYVFFSVRTGDQTYHFTVSPPLYVKAASKQERASAIASAGQAYAGLLEKAVRSFPYEWFHFERFL